VARIWHYGYTLSYQTIPLSTTSFRETEKKTQKLFSLWAKHLLWAQGAATISGGILRKASGVVANHRRSEPEVVLALKPVIAVEYIEGDA
jgi:hypothetical protein